jgi:hypothetical protein
MPHNFAHVVAVTRAGPAELYISARWMHCYRTAMLHDRVRHTRHQVAFTGKVPPFTEADAPAPQEMP